MKHSNSAAGVVVIVDAYRRFISPALAPRCRFQPSCSEYARQATLRFGLLKGLVLTAIRLGKCQPFHPGGFDLVPNVYRLRHKRQPGPRRPRRPKPGGML